MKTVPSTFRTPVLGVHFSSPGAEVTQSNGCGFMGGTFTDTSGHAGYHYASNTAGQSTITAVIDDGSCNELSRVVRTITFTQGTPTSIDATFTLGTHILAAGQQTKLVVNGSPNDSIQVLVKGAASSVYTVIGTLHPNAAGVAWMYIHPSTNSSYFVRNGKGSAVAQSLTVKAVQSLVVSFSGLKGTFTGHIAPSLVGRTVTVYYYVNGGHVTVACTTKTTAGGQYNCSHTFAHGTFHTFAQTNADKYNAAGRSPLHTNTI